MSKFKSHPYVPDWTRAMDGELLNSQELDVLNFIHYCKKYGCRTSNDRIGGITHHTHSMVQRAILKLYTLDLIAIDNFGLRTRVLKPIQYPDRETYEELTRIRGSAESDAAHSAPHIPTESKTPRGFTNSVGGKEAPLRGAADLSRGVPPRTPPGGSRGNGRFSVLHQAAEYGHQLIKQGLTREEAIEMVLAQYRDVVHTDGCFKLKDWLP